MIHTTSVRARSGETVQLRCEARGVPTPITTLWHRQNLIGTSSNNPFVAEKDLVVDLNSAGHYKCIASNVYILPTGGVYNALAQKFISLQVFGKYYYMQANKDFF